MAGDNMTWKLPTEELKTQLEEAKAKINRLRAELIAQKSAACPDSQCDNCRKVRNWDALNGDVQWLLCPTCNAYSGQPCRWAGRGKRGKVLLRPHRDRPWAERPGQDLV